MTDSASLNSETMISWMDFIISTSCLNCVWPLSAFRHSEIARCSSAGHSSDITIHRWPDEITYFKSVGNAAQDLVVAARAAAEAERLGLGTVVEL